MNDFTEDQLVQKTMAGYLAAQHGWRVVMAWNKEVFGAEGTLGRKSDKDVVLTRYLSEALLRLNPGLPDATGGMTEGSPRLPPAAKRRHSP